MARYGYTFIQPIRGNGKYCDLRAWIIGGGFFLFVLELGFMQNWSPSAGLIFPYMVVGYFFASIAEDLPKTGLSSVLVFALVAQALIFWVMLEEGWYEVLTSAPGAQVYIAVILPWACVLIAKSIKATRTSSMR